MEREQQLEVHPKVLENLGKLPRNAASRFLRRWFTRAEARILKDKAGCIETENFSPYKTYNNPFLIYEQ